MKAIALTSVPCKYSSSTTVTEAPSDGKFYARQWAAWAESVGEAPMDSQYYVRRNGVWLSSAPAEVGEAPLDGKQYGRYMMTWTEVVDTTTWASLTGKPATFPPTVPIAQSDVNGLQDDLDSLDGRLVTAETNDVSHNTAISQLQTKDLTHDTRLDDVEATNTTQTTAINGKEPTISGGTTSQW